MKNYGCLVSGCKYSIPQFSDRKFMLKHYLKKHTRTDLVLLSKEYQISNNPYFESTWILAWQLTDKSEVERFA